MPLAVGNPACSLSKTLKSPGSSDQLDVEGYLTFNVALDDLFVFDDDEDDHDEDDDDDEDDHDEDDDDEDDDDENDEIAVSKPKCYPRA
jgi:hypothetical protein